MSSTTERVTTMARTTRSNTVEDFITQAVVAAFIAWLISEAVEFIRSLC